jgi:hypothetical protein
MDAPTVAEALTERHRVELREAVQRLNDAVDRLEYLINCEEQDDGRGATKDA